MLEFFYDHGLYQGHLNAQNLRISDTYSFMLGDLPLIEVTPGFSKLSPEIQA